MDSTATTDQRALLEASSKFAEHEHPVRKLRDGGFSDAAEAAAYRRQAAELGWFSFLVPEELGGGSLSANGVLDAALVAYRRGKALQPGAFVGTNVVARALAEAGTDEQRATVLPRLVAGEDAAVWVPGAPGVHPGTGDVTAVQRDGEYVLSGTATLVAEAAGAAWLLITAAVAGGVAHFLLPADRSGISVTALDSLDISRRYAQVDFDGVVAAASDTLGGDADLGDRLLAVAATLTAAEAVGAMDTDVALAVQYAKDRIAFGRPIGSFQAVKHLLADTSLYVEMCKAVVLAAATALGEDDPDAITAASMAKAFLGDYAIDIVQNCFQVFGGIGYTWEHDQHLYLRRITSDAAAYGDAFWHRERLCRLGGLDPAELKERA